MIGIQYYDGRNKLRYYVTRVEQMIGDERVTRGDEGFEDVDYLLEGLSSNDGVIDDIIAVLIDERIEKGKKKSLKRWYNTQFYCS